MSDENRQLTDYDRKLIEAFHAYQVHGSEIAAARAIGVARHTFSNRLLRYFLRGLDGKLPMQPLPGHVIKSQSATYDADGFLKTQSIRTGLAPSEDSFEVPEGHTVKGESALLDANGNVVQKWVKTARGGIDPADLAEAARIAAELYAPSPAYERPALLPRADLEPDLLNLYPLPDLHLGMHLNGQTASSDWSLDLAVDLIFAMFEDLIRRSPAAHTAVILGGGDMLHADDDTRETRRSGNRLEVAEPYAVVLGKAESLAVRVVEMALLKYERVVVRFLPGNHDPDSAIAIAHFLKAWFRDDERVVVDIDPSLFWFYRWGRVMLAATHGHEAKIDEMPGIMAADRREMWGHTEFAYAHGFHIHHKTRSSGEAGGAAWETHQTPAPRDTYHQGKGYRAGRSLCSITYARDEGEVERTTATVTRVLRSLG